MFIWCLCHAKAAFQCVVTYTSMQYTNFDMSSLSIFDRHFFFVFHYFLNTEFQTDNNDKIGAIYHM